MNTAQILPIPITITKLKGCYCTVMFSEVCELNYGMQFLEWLQHFYKHFSNGSITAVNEKEQIRSFIIFSLPSSGIPIPTPYVLCQAELELWL
jgi:hypothetical protein